MTTTPRKRPANTTPRERSDQRALFEWAAAQACKYPALALMYAIPNGQYRKGQGMEPGTRAGFPDAALPVARGCWFGLFVELKREKGGVVAAEQLAWHNALRLQGYRVAVCKGFDEAQQMVMAYLGSGPFRGVTIGEEEVARVQRGGAA